MRIYSTILSDARQPEVYAGIMEPGNVASVIEDAGILDGLLNVTDSLASLVQSFIPIIEDSQTVVPSRALRRRGSCRRHH